MKTLRSTIAEKGQVTIPKTIRDKLGLRPGTVLSFAVERGKIVMTKEVTLDPIEAARGCLPYLGPVDKLIDDMRGQR